MTNAKFNFFKKDVSQRSVLNVNANNSLENRFINKISCSEQWGPVGSSNWFDGTHVWNTSIGSNGYANVRFVEADNLIFGAGIRLDNSRYYGASGSGQYYVMRWKGNGICRLSMSAGTLTHVSGMSSNVTFTGPDKWSTTSGSDSYAVFQYDGPAQLISLHVRATDVGNVGAFLNSLEIYRKDDEADRDLGKIFRTIYKQSIVDLCPSAIRFMDWIGGNDSHLIRFEHRQSPAVENWNVNYNAGPRYGRTSGTNQYTLAAATGTASSMVHGEVANYQVGTGIVRAGNFNCSAIVVNSTNARVTCTGHPFSNGDKVVLWMPRVFKSSATVTNGSNVITATTNTSVPDGSEVFNRRFPVGTVVTSSTSTTITVSNNASGGSTSEVIEFIPMSKLNQQPGTVTVVDANTFDLNINVSTYGTFAGTAIAEQFITLQVGDGSNDRTPYPIAYATGQSFAGRFGNTYMAANDYKNVVFDKTLAMYKDTSGNWVYGAWICPPEQGNNFGFLSGVPLEICTALVNEVNAMNPVKPVHMWVNVPYMGLTSNDPDYDAAQNFGVKMQDVILNGANGFAGLTNPLLLFIEHSNEKWNDANNAFSQATYGKTRSFQRWPQTGTEDKVSWSTLKSSIVLDDIRQANASSRIKYVMCGMGSQGAGSTTINDLYIDGTTFYAGDTLVTGNPRLTGKKPIEYPHDFFGFAGYIDPVNGAASYETSRIDGVYVPAWVAAAGNATNMEAACASMVNDMINGTNGAGGETIFRYQGTLLPQYCAKLAPYRKTVIMYEGGWDHDVSMVAAGGIGTASQYFAVGTFTSGSATITNLNSTWVAALTVGNWVYGFGIPDGAKIASKATTTITLDKNATISTTIGEVMAFTDKMAYLRAVKNSTAWKNAELGFFDAFGGTVNAGMPADYIQFSIRWGHGFPNSYGFTNTEYADHDQLWYAEGVRNRALPV